MIPLSSSTFPAVLGSLPEHPRLGESLSFQFNGLIVVFTALIIIWCLVELMGWAFRLHARRSAAPATAVPPPPISAAPPAPAPAVVTGPSPEILAVITAAVHAVLAGRPHRIRAISPASFSVDWAREGRRTIFASHQPR